MFNINFPIILSIYELDILEGGGRVALTPVAGWHVLYYYLTHYVL